MVKESHHGADAVALLAEGVDRNLNQAKPGQRVAAVALLAEGVDRNDKSSLPTNYQIRSPSSRRAWIEIAYLLGSNAVK